MIVFRWVSSKSEMWLDTPLMKAAFMMSTRSRRPNSEACAGPEKGASAVTAISTVW